MIAYLLLLLAYPALWEQTNTAPWTLCQVGGAVCLIRGSRELVMAERIGDVVTIKPVPRRDAAVVWNQAILRTLETNVVISKGLINGQ